MKEESDGKEEVKVRKKREGSSEDGGWRVAEGGQAWEERRRTLTPTLLTEL